MPVSQPTCHHCNGTAFAPHSAQQLGAAGKFYLIFCTGCGAPAGAVLDPDLSDIERKIDKIGALVSQKR